jgi:hypothetical protein
MGPEASSTSWARESFGPGSSLEADDGDGDGARAMRGAGAAMLCTTMRLVRGGDGMVVAAV